MKDQEKEQQAWQTRELAMMKKIEDLRLYSTDLEAKLEKAEEQTLKTGFKCSMCGEGYTRAISLDKIEDLEAKLEKALEYIKEKANSPAFFESEEAKEVLKEIKGE